MNIPLARPDITQHEIDAVVAVLKTPNLSLGPMLPEFERRFADRCGTRYAVAVSSGTAALHLLVRGMEWGDGDEIITTPFSFVASTNCILYERAKPVFADIDPKTWNIDPSAVAAAVTERTKGIIAVDVFGQIADFDPIQCVADRHNLKVIEDSCEALGGRYHGRQAGSIADAGVFGFYPNKQITTGEGGLIVTNDKDLYKKALLMRSHGLVNWQGPFDDVFGPWHREMVMEGLNFRITEFQCMLGVSQLKKIDRFIAHRTKLAAHYHERLKDAPVRLQVQSEASRSAWHMMIVLLELEKLSKGKLRIFNELEARFIHPSIHYYPIPFHPFYRDLGFEENDFPMAADYYKRAFTMPMHVGLEIEDVDYVCDVLIDVLS